MSGNFSCDGPANPSEAAGLVQPSQTFFLSLPCATSRWCSLLKFGDSLFRCKQLKRAALGRMCTVMRKQVSRMRCCSDSCRDDGGAMWCAYMKSSNGFCST